MNLDTHRGSLWLTRDSDDVTGVLCDTIEIWGLRPIRSRALNGAGAIWLPAIGRGAVIGRVPLTAALAQFKVIPETDRECIRIERTR